MKSALYKFHKQMYWLDSLYFVDFYISFLYMKDKN